MKRVLKPGGRALVGELDPVRWTVRGVLMKTAGELVPGLPNDGDLALADEDSIQRELRRNGLDRRHRSPPPPPTS